MEGVPGNFPGNFLFQNVPDLNLTKAILKNYKSDIKKFIISIFAYIITQNPLLTKIPKKIVMVGVLGSFPGNFLLYNAPNLTKVFSYMTRLIKQ